jgi:hypothetical protein
MSEETTNTTESTENTENTANPEFSRVVAEFIEHNRRAFEETGKAIDALLPPEFKEHSAAARDEFRKGLKVVVDYAIDELEKVTKEQEAPAAPSTDEEPPQSTTGRNKVKVQVE